MKKRVLITILALSIFVCVCPIRLVRNCKTYGINLPWFSTVDSDRGLYWSLDALIWNYTDRVLKYDYFLLEETGVELPQYELERSIDLFNKFSIWNSTRLCGKDFENKTYIDWEEYLVEFGPVPRKDRPVPIKNLEVSASEIVFESGTGKHNVSIEAKPVNGTVIEEMILKDLQTGESVVMNKDLNVFRTEISIDSDVKNEQGSFASEDYHFVVCSDDGRYKEQVEIVVRTSVGYKYEYALFHLNLYTKSDDYITDSNPERVERLTVILEDLKVRGFIKEYYTSINQVSFVSDDGIKQSISIKDDFSLSGYDDVDDYFENKIINN